MRRGLPHTLFFTVTHRPARTVLGSANIAGSVGMVSDQRCLSLSAVPCVIGLGTETISPGTSEPHDNAPICTSAGVVFWPSMRDLRSGRAVPCRSGGVTYRQQSRNEFHATHESIERAQDGIGTLMHDRDEMRKYTLRCKTIRVLGSETRCTIIYFQSHSKPRLRRRSITSDIGVKPIHIPPVPVMCNPRRTRSHLSPSSTAATRSPSRESVGRPRVCTSLGVMSRGRDIETSTHQVPRKRAHPVLAVPCPVALPPCEGSAWHSGPARAGPVSAALDADACESFCCRSPSRMP